jgi:hypothetical protein
MKIVTILIGLLFLLAGNLQASKTHPTSSRVAPKAHVAKDAGPRQNFLQRLLGIKPKQKPAAIAVAPKPDVPPPRSKVAKRPSSGQRSAPNKASVARTAPKAAPARTVPQTKVATARPPSPPKETVKRAKAPTSCPLAALPSPAPTNPKWRPKYSRRSQLGRNMDAKWGEVVAQSVQPTKAIAEPPVVARVTAYNKSDKWSARRQSATSVRLREAIPGKQIGVAAVPTALVGSYIVVTINGKEHVYLGADLGSAVEKRTAARGSALVVDLFCTKGQKWDDYKTVEIFRVSGAGHLLMAHPAERSSYLEWETFNTVCELARGNAPSWFTQLLATNG